MKEKYDVDRIQTLGGIIIGLAIMFYGTLGAHILGAMLIIVFFLTYKREKVTQTKSFQHQRRKDG